MLSSKSIQKILLLLVCFIGVNNFAFALCTMNGKEYLPRKTYEIDESLTGLGICKNDRNGALVLASEIQYLKGLPNGVAKIYYDGKLHLITNYKNYIREGVETEYISDNVRVEKTYKNDEILFTEEYTNNKLSEKYNSSTRIGYNNKGQLKELHCGDKAFTKADAEWCGFNGKTGTANLYATNGKIERSEQYLNGKLNGLYKEYDTETGKVIKSIQYKDGASVGEVKASAQGDTLFKSNCDATFKKCEETKYYEDTKTIESYVKWENKIKVFEQYNYQNGNQRQLTVYKDGNYLLTEFFDSGKKSFVTELTTVKTDRDSQETEIIKHGSQDSFDEDGNLKSHEQFDKGNRQGLSKFYAEIKGHKVINEQTYVKGQLTSLKIIVDGKDILIKEFMKDGSTKSTKRLNKSPIDEYIK